MRPIIILYIILSGELISQAQLNFDGNPLTGNTEYKAEESHFSRRNVKEDYKHIEVVDGRTVSETKGPFAPSPIDNVATSDKHLSRASNNTNREGQVEHRTKGPPLENIRAPNIRTYHGTTSIGPERNKTKILERPSESFPKGSVLLTDMQSTAETRQLRGYPIQPPRPMAYQSAVLQDSFQADGPFQGYDPSDQTSQLRNPETYKPLPASPVSLASGQTLNEYLNFRTPEETQRALQNDLIIHEQTARGVQISEAIDRIQPGVVEQNNAQSERGVELSGSTMLNENPNYEYLASQRQENADFQGLKLLSGVAVSNIVHDATGQSSYSSGQQRVPPRGNNFDLQLRRNMLAVAGTRRQPPRYRGYVDERLRGRPWAQPRINPRPLVYHYKGPVYSRPPDPVEVIYTRSPGASYGSSLPNNPLVHYEDARHWFPEADEPPPQKDVYYSQLYAQSYDPHYYNYIAKTGKIKPWLYGKLDKHEKSIWWELFASLKKHGMKNIMNPMFLLGMTIPTLTILLTALVQKRSIGRSDSGGHTTDKLIDEYVQRLQESINCYEKRIKDDNATKDYKCW